MRYGEQPYAVSEAAHLAGWWAEFMHYLYLPIRMASDRREPGSLQVRLPDRLRFLAGTVMSAALDARAHGHSESYIYLTARHGYATPDNPINRPGWHCDGFGSDDVNYIWWDRWPTRFACQPFEDISADHVVSAEQFEQQIDHRLVRVYPDQFLYRLSPFVVHTTPVVPEGGGMRRFLKLSFSRHRYNLLGNSRNYLFDYDWKMWPREQVRNDPAYAGGDYYEDR